MKEKVLRTVTIGSVFLAAFFLPFTTTFSNIIFGVLIATTVFSFTVYGIDFSPFKKKYIYFLSPLVFFIPVFIGIFYSPIDIHTLKEVKRMVFLFLLPSLILRKDLRPEKPFIWGAYGIIIGSIISSGILLLIDFHKIASGPISIYSIFNYYHTGLNFTALFGLHPIYMGSYYLMGLIILFNKDFKVKKGLRIVGIPILLLGILFLNSRIIYGLTVLITLIYLIDYLPWKILVLLITTLIIVFVIVFPHINKSYVYVKLVSGTKWELTENIGTYNTDKKFPADSRMSRWQVAWSLIEERPIFGFGTGTERVQLSEKYQINHMKKSLEDRYNSHNQFIGFMIRYGIWGTALLLVFFIGNFYTAIYHKHLIFLCFLLMISGIFLVENYLDRNMGLNFVALFGILFYLKHYSRKTKDPNFD